MLAVLASKALTNVKQCLEAEAFSLTQSKVVVSTEHEAVNQAENEETREHELDLGTTSTMLRKAASSFMTVLPPSLLLKVSEMDSAQGSLIGEERKLIEGVTSTRRRELVAGRVLARELMAQMGHAPSPITQSDGAPVWPTGLCGSISHTASHVAVAMAPTANLDSVGIDIEDGRNLGKAASGIGAADEIELIVAHPFAGDREAAARLLFSAKEALFKCQAPLSGNTDLDFTDVRLDLTPDGIFRGLPTGNIERSTLQAIIATRVLLKQFQGLMLAVAWIPKI